jgi:hypothetical protein
VTVEISNSGRFCELLIVQFSLNSNCEIYCQLTAKFLISIRKMCDQQEKSLLDISAFTLIIE